ncbi:MAG: hypothetical protein LBH59_04230 [Planctomycetaceae bacterium]|nr:hypothetical protein [Planctomycetaceae bacterium]
MERLFKGEAYRPYRLRYILIINSISERIQNLYWVDLTKFINYRNENYMENYNVG